MWCDVRACLFPLSSHRDGSLTAWLHKLSNRLWAAFESIQMNMSGFICYVVVQCFLYHVIRPEEWQKGNCFTGLYQAEINLISGTNCTRQTCDCSARVCQSYCAVWFDRKWIPWKEDVATGVRRWKWSGKIIKKGASVNEGERLQRLFLYMHICVLCLCILCVCPSLLGGEVMMMDGGQKRDWGSCA